MAEYSFEKLDVWKKVKNFTNEIYKVTAQFPSSEKLGPVSKLRRASISVSSNIAERTSKVSGADQGRFYNTAHSSAVKVLKQQIMSPELEFIDEKFSC